MQYQVYHTYGFDASEPDCCVSSAFYHIAFFLVCPRVLNAASFAAVHVACFVLHHVHFPAKLEG